MSVVGGKRTLIYKDEYSGRVANAQRPAAKRRAGIATPAAQTSSAPAKTAEARTAEPYHKPPPTRSPAIKKARVAAASPKSLVGNAPQWIGGGPTDADNRRGQYQGTVALQVNVEPSGRVSNCAPVRGSGDAGLDALTCRLVRERARFTPAHNSQGRPVASEYIKLEAALELQARSIFFEASAVGRPPQRPEP